MSTVLLYADWDAFAGGQFGTTPGAVSISSVQLGKWQGYACRLAQAESLTVPALAERTGTQVISPTAGQLFLSFLPPYIIYKGNLLI